MFFVRKDKEIEMDFLKKIVHTYFAYIRKKALSLNASELSELLRYSLCQVLNLETKGYSQRIEHLSEGVVDVLKPCFRGTSILRLPEAKRQAYLEACIHCIEMARKKADV